MVEWADRTNEVAIEQEIDAIITAANDGDLSRRLDIHNKEGFFLNLSNGLNRLVGIATMSSPKSPISSMAWPRGNWIENLAANIRVSLPSCSKMPMPPSVS